MNEQLLIFAFEGNISTKILDELIGCKKYVIRRTRKSFLIENFLEYISENDFRYIIGLGHYSGRDKDALRIEGIVKNRFRNDNIGESKEFRLDSFLLDKPNISLKEAFGLGNSWCNLVSYKIMELRKKNDRSFKYSFVHIPDTFSVDLASEILNEKLSGLLVE